MFEQLPIQQIFYFGKLVIDKRKLVLLITLKTPNKYVFILSVQLLYHRIHVVFLYVVNRIPEDLLHDYHLNETI